MAREIAASSLLRCAGVVLFVFLSLAEGVTAEEDKSRPGALELWPTPPQLVGRCSTVWTSSVGKYDLPYRVDFGGSGSFRWWAPILSGGVELGNGVFLSAPQTIVRDDGSWEVSYFGANRFTPDPANSTNCCCEYVGQAGPDQPRILADYCVAGVPNTAHLPMQDVCAPYVRQCPGNNATALQTMGKPFIEIYSPCVPLVGDAWVVWPSIIAVLVTACVALQLAMVIRERLRKQADEVFEEVEEGYQSMESPSWLQAVLKAKSTRAKRQVSMDSEYSVAAASTAASGLDRQETAASTATWDGV